MYAIKSFALLSFPIAFCAGLSTLFYCKQFDLSYNYSLVFLNSLSTFFIYNLVQFLPVIKEKRQGSKSSFFYDLRRPLFIVLPLTFLIILALALKELGVADFLNYAHLFFLCLLYENPKGSKLRNIPFLKSFLIAYIWTFAIVFPLSLRAQALRPEMLLEFFIFTYGLCLIFDYRDKLEDKVNGIRTIFTEFSLKSSLTIMYATNITSCLLTLYLFQSSHTYSRIFFALSYALILACISERRTNLFYLYCVDGLYLVKLILLF